MKFAWIVWIATLWMVTPARSQEAQSNLISAPRWDYGAPDGRFLFPKNWVRGFVDFEGAPPHNEPDLGRCGPSNPALGASAPCTAFSRYMIGGYLELQPFGKTFLKHVFLFYTPRFSFGNNLPQVNYTASFERMAHERSIGVGIELPMRLELRVLQHRTYWLGRYNGPLGSADLGTTGPYGLYSTVGLRWYFGGYGRYDGVGRR